MSDAPKLVNDFLTYLEHGRQYSKYTLVSYRTDLKQFLEHLWSQVDFNVFPNGITQKDVRSYLAHLRGQGFSEATVSRRLASLRSFYRWMLRQKMVDQNPTRGFSSPRVVRAAFQILTEYQVQTLIMMADRLHVWGRRDHAILNLLYSTGIKIGELAALDWDDLGLQLICIRGEGRGGQDRNVNLGGRAYESLLRYLKLLENHPRYKAFDHEAVFLNRSGAPLTARSIGRIVEKHAKWAGLPKWVSPQTLRHSMAAHLLDRGANVEDIQAILGHQSVYTTKIYTKMPEKATASMNSGRVLI